MSDTGEGDEKRLINTFPYPVVKGIPTYDTDYGGLGQKSMSMGDILGIEEQTRAATADAIALGRGGKPKRKKRPKIQNGIALKKLDDGTVVHPPPLSRSTSVGDLGEISFVGPNFYKTSPQRLAQFVKGKRLSMCWDNVSSFGSDCWTTTNAEFGSVNEPSVLHQKRAGSVSFEKSRFLPHHPHWQDRPYKPGKYIKCPKSTYADLGSYYVDGYKLPAEYQHTLTKRKRRRDGPLVM